MTEEGREEITASAEEDADPTISPDDDQSVNEEEDVLIFLSILERLFKEKDEMKKEVKEMEKKLELKEEETEKEREEMNKKIEEILELDNRLYTLTLMRGLK